MTEVVNPGSFDAHGGTFQEYTQALKSYREALAEGQGLDVDELHVWHSRTESGNPWESADENTVAIGGLLGSTQPQRAAISGRTDSKLS